MRALETSFLRTSKALGVLSMLMGVLSLLAWLLGLRLIGEHTAEITSKENVSLLFLLSGFVVWGQHRRVSSLWLSALSGLALLISGATLLQDITGVDLHIDQLLSADPLSASAHPGRMAPNSAVAFLCVGLSLLLRDAARSQWRLLRMIFVLSALFIGFLGFVDDLFSASVLYQRVGYRSMSPFTASGLLVLCMGLLLANPEYGVTAILAQEGLSGFIARRLTPTVCMIPVGLGFVFVWGQRVDLYDFSFEAALMATSIALLVSALVVWGASSQGRVEAEQRQIIHDERFLFSLGELLRPMDSPSDALHMVVSRLGEHLEASRCFLIELEPTRAVVHRDYHRGLASLAGELPLASLNPEVSRRLREGQTVSVDDLQTDSLSAPYYTKLYAPLQLRSKILVPLMRDGVLVSALALGDNATRHWSDRERLLCQLSAEKVWLWFEHLRRAQMLHQREHALAESEARYRELYEGSPDMHVSVNPEGILTDCNRTILQSLGYEKHELIGQRFLMLYHPDTAESVQKGFQQFQKNGEIHDPERVLVCKDGSALEVSLNANAVRAPNGDMLGGHAVFRDTRKQKQLEKMKERDRFFQLSIDLVGVMKDGAFTQVNPAFTRTLGWSSEELTSQPYRNFLHPEDIVASENEANARNRDRSTPNGQFTNRYRCKDGSYRWLQWSGAPFEDGSWYTIARDVTREKEAEQELWRKQSELSASLKERETLLHEIHHRVKNNLQIISSLLNMQLRQTSDTTTRSALQGCKSRIETIALIHEQLYQAKSYSAVQFSSYIESLAKQVFFATNTQHKISLSIDAAPITLAVNKAIPCGLLVNELLTNAVKYAFAQQPGEIKVSLHSIGEHQILLEVADDGVGLPEGFSLSDSKGLGMTLITTLLEQLDGKLTLQRQRGTTFQITFPAY